MTIKLNDEYHEVEEGTSLSAFIERIGLMPQGIAVAINYQVVPKDKWGGTILTDQLELILIHAVSGG